MLKLDFDNFLNATGEIGFVERSLASLVYVNGLPGAGLQELVVFESGEDVITVSHHAKNRDIFAKGALVAAKFLAHKDKGLFSMQDVLGLN